MSSIYMACTPQPCCELLFRVKAAAAASTQLRMTAADCVLSTTAHCEGVVQCYSNAARGHVPHHHTTLSVA